MAFAARRASEPSKVVCPAGVARASAHPAARDPQSRRSACCDSETASSPEPWNDATDSPAIVSQCGRGIRLDFDIQGVRALPVLECHESRGGLACRRRLEPAHGTTAALPDVYALPEHMTQRPRPRLAVRLGVVGRGVTEVEHELTEFVRRATRVGGMLDVARCALSSATSLTAAAAGALRAAGPPASPPAQGARRDPSDGQLRASTR